MPRARAPAAGAADPSALCDSAVAEFRRKYTPHLTESIINLPVVVLPKSAWASRPVQDAWVRASWTTGNDPLLIPIHESQLRAPLDEDEEDDADPDDLPQATWLQLLEKHCELGLSAKPRVRLLDYGKHFSLAEKMRNQEAGYLLRGSKAACARSWQEWWSAATEVTTASVWATLQANPSLAQQPEQGPQQLVTVEPKWILMVERVAVGTTALPSTPIFLQRNAFQANQYVQQPQAAPAPAPVQAAAQPAAQGPQPAPAPLAPAAPAPPAAPAADGFPVPAGNVQAAVGAGRGPGPGGAALAAANADGGPGGGLGNAAPAAPSPPVVSSLQQLAARLRDDKKLLRPKVLKRELERISGFGVGQQARREFVQHVFSEDAALRVRGGAERVASFTNVTPVEDFIQHEHLRRLISHPTRAQMQAIHAKASAVGKVRPLLQKRVKAEDEAATAAAMNDVNSESKLAGPASSGQYVDFHGSSFLVSPLYLATAFHNLYEYKATAAVVPTVEGQARRWQCRSPAGHFSVRFPLIQDAAGEAVEIVFNESHIVYGPLLAHGNHRNVDSTIWYDLVLVRLNHHDAAALEQLLPAACFIPLFTPARALLLEPFNQKAKAQQALFVIGFPAGADQNEDEGLVISMRDNTLQGFWEWEALYSTPTAHGMSGGPGLLADGTGALMHRRRGPELKPNATQQSLCGAHSGPLVNYGLNLELVLHDEGFGPRATAPPLSAYARRLKLQPAASPPPTREQVIWQELNAWYEKKFNYPQAAQSKSLPALPLPDASSALLTAAASSLSANSPLQSAEIIAKLLPGILAHLKRSDNA